MPLMTSIVSIPIGIYNVISETDFLFFPFYVVTLI
jgi:hypothetical protein